MMIDIQLVWLIYLFSAVVFFICCWRLTAFIDSAWVKVILRFPLVGFFLTPINPPALSEGILNLVPAVIVLALGLFDQSLLYSSNVLIFMAMGIFLSLFLGFLMLFIKRRVEKN